MFRLVQSLTAIPFSAVGKQQNPVEGGRVLGPAPPLRPAGLPPRAGLYREIHSNSGFWLSRARAARAWSPRTSCSAACEVRPPALVSSLSDHACANAPTLPAGMPAIRSRNSVGRTKTQGPSVLSPAEGARFRIAVANDGRSSASASSARTSASSPVVSNAGQFFEPGHWATMADASFGGAIRISVRTAIVLPNSPQSWPMKSWSVPVNKANALAGSKIARREERERADTTKEVDQADPDQNFLHRHIDVITMRRPRHLKRRRDLGISRPRRFPIVARRSKSGRKT